MMGKLKKGLWCRNGMNPSIRRGLWTLAYSPAVTKDSGNDTGASPALDKLTAFVGEFGQIPRGTISYRRYSRSDGLMGKVRQP